MTDDKPDGNLKKFLIDLASNPKNKKVFTDFIQLLDHSGLSDHERDAILSRDLKRVQHLVGRGLGPAPVEILSWWKQK